MRIGDERESENVEDMRGKSGGGGGFRLGAGLSIGGVVLALVAAYIFGFDPRALLGMGDGSQQQAPVSQNAAKAPEPDARVVFVSRVLGTTEDAWAQIFAEAGRRYHPPKLVLFHGSFPTACGTGQAAAGPFYCPGEAKVYIDLRFYDAMRQRFPATGDFAQAYVIAHEVGHHVQNLLGIAHRVERERGRLPEAAFNRLSVRLELQADCFAGVWANRVERAKRILEPGDVEEAIGAAAAIGDDTLQKQSTGHVVPDSFTHGTSEQRVRWLRKGLETGNPNACDTFSAAQV